MKLPDIYIVAGTDLRPLVEDLLQEMDAGREREGSLLIEAERERDVAEAAAYGRSYVMSHVGPRVWGEEGTRPELLLFAALSLFGADAAVPWLGCRDHIERALCHLRSIGEAEGARLLRDAVEQAAYEEPDQLVSELRARSLGNDPGRLAAHDQEMAKAARRELRAADELVRGDV